MSKKQTRGARPRRPSPSVSKILRELRRKPADEEKRLVAEFLENLRAALAYTNVTRAELGERLGVQRAAVSKLLSGQRALTLSHVARIAHALGASAHVSFRYPAATKPMPVDPDQHGQAVEERRRGR